MRLLVGPGLLDPSGREAHLVKALKRTADVRTFDQRTRTLEQLCATLPEGWIPDAILIRDAEFYKMPSGLERAEWPVFGLVGDYNLSMNQLLPVLGCFDRFYCDARGVRFFTKLGFDTCEFFCLYGYDPEVHRDYGEEKRWDVLFIGNLNHAVQQARASALYRLARLADRYRVRITTGLYGEDYARALSSAHLVYNSAIRGEANMRFFEALGCGATVMSQPLDELDGLGFCPDEHYLAYDDPAEAVVRYFEEWTEARRSALRENARRALPDHTYDRRAEALVAMLARTEIDTSQRRLAQLPPEEAARRWALYRSDTVRLPAGESVSRLHPVLVNWQRQLLEDEGEVANLDFALWSWWADLLAASGLDGALAQFLADRQSLLEPFGCYPEMKERLQAKINTLLYGFHVRT